MVQSMGMSWSGTSFYSVFLFSFFFLILQTMLLVVRYCFEDCCFCGWQVKLWVNAESVELVQFVLNIKYEVRHGRVVLWPD